MRPPDGRARSLVKCPCKRRPENGGAAEDIAMPKEPSLRASLAQTGRPPTLVQPNWNARAAADAHARRGSRSMLKSSHRGWKSAEQEWMQEAMLNHVTETPLENRKLLLRQQLTVQLGWARTCRLGECLRKLCRHGAANTSTGSAEAL